MSCCLAGGEPHAVSFVTRCPQWAVTLSGWGLEPPAGIEGRRLQTARPSGSGHPAVRLRPRLRVAALSWPGWGLLGQRSPCVIESIQPASRCFQGLGHKVHLLSMQEQRRRSLAGTDWTGGLRAFCELSVAGVAWRGRPSDPAEAHNQMAGPAAHLHAACEVAGSLSIGSVHWVPGRLQAGVQQRGGPHTFQRLQACPWLRSPCGQQ